MLGGPSRTGSSKRGDKRQGGKRGNDKGDDSYLEDSARESYQSGVSNFIYYHKISTKREKGKM